MKKFLYSKQTDLKIDTTCDPAHTKWTNEGLEVNICHLTQFAVYKVQAESTGDIDNGEQPADSEDGGLGSGAVAGIVIGVILAVILLLILIKLVYSNVRKSRSYRVDNHIELVSPDQDD